MRTILNASKARQAVPAGSLKKREPSKKHPRNKLGLVTEDDEPKSSYTVKLKRRKNFMLKLQI